MAGTHTAHDVVKSGAFMVSNEHFAQMREIAKAVYDDRSLLADFEKDPEGTAARINGFEVPARISSRVGT